MNSLWPRTAIATAAVNMLGGEQMMNASRKVDIMADAAYHILKRNSRDCTGNFFIDDEVLNEEGITDMEPYAVKPGTPACAGFLCLSI